MADSFVDNNKRYPAVRLPVELLEQATALIPLVEQDPEMRGLLGKVSRSDVLRLALVRGFHAIQTRAEDRKRNGQG